MRSRELVRLTFGVSELTAVYQMRFVDIASVSAWKYLGHRKQSPSRYWNKERCLCTSTLHWKLR